MAKTKPKGISPELEAAIAKMLKDVMADPEASLTDKCKVVDRALNLEKVKQKDDASDWGAGFIVDDEAE